MVRGEESMDNERLRECFIRAGKGDMQAFSEVYSELKVPLYTVILRIVKNRATAEDVMQDTFLKLMKCPPDTSVKNPRAWVYKTARNLSLDTLKKRRESELQEDIKQEGSFEYFVGTRIDIESALSALPCEERQIVSLHLSAGLTFKEISGVTGLSVPAAYRRYLKTIKALRSALDGGEL